MIVTEVMITGDRITVADLDTINDLIATSRAVLKAHRIQSWDAPISLITDDLASAHERVPNPLHRVNKKKSYHGFCWSVDTTFGRSHVLWFKNAGGNRNREDVVRTLCHEVTHALISTSSHGRSWRRAYAMLLPFWLNVMVPHLYVNPIGWRLHDEVLRVVKRYRPKRQDLTPNDVRVEAAEHVVAADRAWVRENGLYIPTNV